jgi:hypothetical protein
MYETLTSFGRSPSKDAEEVPLPINLAPGQSIFVYHRVTQIIKPETHHALFEEVFRGSIKPVYFAPVAWVVARYGEAFRGDIKTAQGQEYHIAFSYRGQGDDVQLIRSD